MQRYSRSELSLGGCYCSNFFCVSIQTQFASLEYVGTQMGWERELQHFLTWSSTHRQGISPRGENIRSLVSGRSNLTKVGHGFPRTLAGPFLVSMVKYPVPSCFHFKCCGCFLFEGILNLKTCASVLQC